jgi:hypothetical protein
MNTGDALFFMFVGHCLMDYCLQTDFIAKHKSPHNSLPGVPWYYVMTAHAATHAGVVGFILNPYLGVAEGAAHWIIDLFKCEGLTNIHVDQALHILCKVAWLLIWCHWCH